MRIRFFVVVAILATALLFSGGVVNAQGVDVQAQIAQLQAMIQSLLQQIGALQTQQGTPQTWCHTFNRNLRIGDSSPEIDMLATALSKESLFSATRTYSDFDENIASAVVQFQEKYISEILAPYGLRRGTGYVGPSTRRKLNALYGCGTTPTPACTPNWACDWGQCINGYQSYVVFDSNKCGLPTTNANVSCPTLVQTCTPSTQPSITVTSQTADETWSVGETHTITWQATGLDNSKVSILLKNPVTYKTYYVTPSKVLASLGSYSWTVPSSIATGAGSGYKVNINYTNGSGNVVAARSNGSVTLSAVPGTPAVSLTSPTGAETWEQGSTHTITWSYSSLGSSTKIAIGLQTASGVFRQITPSVPVSFGSYTWTVPTNSALFQPGDYRVKIYSLEGNAILDVSDNYITIVAPGTIQPAITVNLQVSGGSQAPTIQSGSSIDLRWTSTNANNGCSINSTPNDSSITVNNKLPANNTITVRPTNTTTYTVICYNVGSNYQTTQGISNSVNINVSSATQPSITVTSPNGGENWKVGETRTITWTSSNFGSMGVSINLLNPGATGDAYLKNIALNLPNNGAYQWTIPSSISAGTYNLMLVSSGGEAATDYSNSTFRIGSAIAQPQSSITVTSPNGGENWKVGETRNITWTSVGLNSGSNQVSIILISPPSTTPTNIALNIPASTGSYAWTIPSTITPNSYYIQVLSGNPAVGDASNGYFTISAASPLFPSIFSRFTVSVDGGTTLYQGAKYNATWPKTTVGSTYVTISLYKGGTFLQYLDSYGGNDGIFSWTVPMTLAPGSDYRIRVNKYKDTTLYGESAIFSVMGPTITVTSPNGGEVWPHGSKHSVTWTKNGNTGIYVTISLYKGGTFLQYLDNYGGNDGIFSWTVPMTLAPGSDYRIRVNKYKDTTLYGESDNYFAVVPQSLGDLGFDLSQNSLASISDALKAITEQIKQMMGQ